MRKCIAARHQVILAVSTAVRILGAPCNRCRPQQQTTRDANAGRDFLDQPVKRLAVAEIR